MSRDIVEHSRDLLSQFVAGKVTSEQVIASIDWDAAIPPGEQHVAGVWQCVFEKRLDICHLIQLKLIEVMATRSRKNYDGEEAHNASCLKMTAHLAFCFLDVTKDGYNKALFSKSLKIWMEAFDNSPRFKKALIETGEWYIDMAKDNPYYKKGTEEQISFNNRYPKRCKAYAKRHMIEVIKPREVMLKKIRSYK
jgi:hypothetical protein